MVGCRAPLPAMTAGRAVRGKQGRAFHTVSSFRPLVALARQCEARRMMVAGGSGQHMPAEGWKLTTPQREALGAAYAFGVTLAMSSCARCLSNKRCTYSPSFLCSGLQLLTSIATSCLKDHAPLAWLLPRLRLSACASPSCPPSPSSSPPVLSFSLVRKGFAVWTVILCLHLGPCSAAGATAARGTHVASALSLLMRHV